MQSALTRPILYQLVGVDVTQIHGLGPYMALRLIAARSTRIMKAQEREDLLQALKARFEKNMHRHKGVAWANVQARLEGNPDALRSLREMELTGGEPDVIGQDREGGDYSRSQECLLRP
jgi:hypothetical protein